jgi:uncharacterized Zn-finger protein
MVAQNNPQHSSQHNPLETLYVNSKKVSCQGEREGFKSGSGHPTIYLDMGKNDFVICPYCSKFFTIKHKAAPIFTSKTGE